MPLDIDAARTTLADAHRHDPSALSDRIGTLARPRMTGTAGAREVEGSIREAFEAAGYGATELPFDFSSWPGRFGLSASGLVVALTGVGAAALIQAGVPIVALVVLAAGLAIALLPLVTLGRALRSLPWGREETRNLLFTRPGTRPSWLVMAHRDTKSQAVPTLVRTGAVLAGALGWLGLVALAGLWLGGESLQLPGLVTVAGGVTAVAGAVLALSWASDRSPGALDNGTGLAAMLAVAERERGGEVGFVVTDGEELGLAGARALVGALPPVQGVINLDGLDDRGVLRIAEGHGWRRRGSAPQLAAALLTAARALDVEIERRPLPRSILVDHAPLASAGIPALTVVRGGWQSLARIHRPGDVPARLAGRGAAETATVLGAALRLLRETAAGHLAGERGTGS
jgi:hypothetical protein